VSDADIRDCLSACKYQGLGERVDFEHFVALFGVDTGEAEAELDDVVDRARQMFELLDLDDSGSITVQELYDVSGFHNAFSVCGFHNVFSVCGFFFMM
jgi:Ca2+-binding EF-hand superfamily protein